MTVKIIIPAIPPSMNKFLGRENAWEYRKLKQEWKDMIYILCRERPTKPFEKATVRITYFFPTRTRHDPDNYAGKMILDGLTAAKIIKDDSFDCIELILRGDYDKKKPRTEIEVILKE